jgi:hypothetical protein
MQVCLYVCMLVCLYFLYVRMLVCLYVRMFVCLFVCMFVCVHVCMFVFLYVCKYVCLYVYMYVARYVCLYVCLYVCMYVCMYVGTYVRMYVLYVCTYVLYVCIYVCRRTQLHTNPTNVTSSTAGRVVSNAPSQCWAGGWILASFVFGLWHPQLPGVCDLCLDVVSGAVERFSGKFSGCILRWLFRVQKRLLVKVTTSPSWVELLSVPRPTAENC